MKYKKKLIQRLKDKYGVSNLFFFKGAKRLVKKDWSPLIMDYDRYITIPIVVCSLKRNPKKVYKNRPDISVYGRYKHDELQHVLQSLQAQSRGDYYALKPKQLAYVKSVLFEPWDAEFKDLYDLKQAYLMAYLAEI